MGEVVDFTGGDSDDDLSNGNQDAHAIALTLPHQIQPQQVMQGFLPHEGETLRECIKPTFKTW